MPRKLLVGAIAAGALAVTAGTAFALTGADDATTRGATAPTASPTASPTTSFTTPSSDDDDPTSGSPATGSPDQAPAEGTLTAEEASTIVRNEYGGTVTEVERETEHGRQEWKVEINAADGKSYDVRVDAQSGNVTRTDQDDDNHDDHDDD